MFEASTTDESVVAYDVERRPAAWVTARTQRREHAIRLAMAIFFAIAVAVLALAVGHRLSIVGSALFLAIVIAMKPHADRYIDRHLRLRQGARAEEIVGETLNELRRESWIVMHDVEQPGEGNVDHIASGPNGVFMIETKLRRYEDAHLKKARRQAAKLHDELGVWVTPVICLHLRKGNAFKTQGVWVVPRQELLGWLRRQSNTPVPFEQLARFADHV